MGFWNDPKPPEAKRQYRWQLLMGGFAPWVAKKVTKPSFTMTETKHSYLNHTYYYPGRVEWQTIDVTIVDPALPDIAQTIMQIMEGSGYIIPQAATHVPTTIGKDVAQRALGRVQINQLDSMGAVIEAWTLHSPFLKDVKFAELAYDSDDISEITMTIRYDWAALETNQNSLPVVNLNGQSAATRAFPTKQFGATGPE